DDFAHHPTAISGALKALRTRYAGRRLWAILEPRSNTLRRKVFESELAESLTQADHVVLAGVFKSDSIPEAERLDPANVIARVNASGTPARLLSTADDIVEAIAPELREGDVVAILSNGGFGGIYEKLPARLNALREASAPA
ncbi:MAG TPA: cyanophycin synthetase, partial [Candidatus Angelobacter sp.]|nr:cyanophycin synthetase [Candidatus Angelobacter sp.]